MDHSGTEQDILGLSITKASLAKKNVLLNRPGTHQQSDLKSPKLPKALFLSTWRGPSIPGHSAPHASIHHFCTETHGPQLPPQLAMVSKSAHSNKYPKHTLSIMSSVEIYGEVKNEVEKKHEVIENELDNNIDEDRLDNIEKRWDLVKEGPQNVINKEDQRDFIVPQIQLESSSSVKSQKSASSGRKKSSRSWAPSAYASCRNEASPLDSTNGLNKDDTDRLISTARARLRKELKESEKAVSPSEALGVSGARDTQIESLLRSLQPKSASARSDGSKNTKERTGTHRTKESERKVVKKQKDNSEKKEETASSRRVASNKVIRDETNLRGEKSIEVNVIPPRKVGNLKEKVTK